MLAADEERDAAAIAGVSRRQPRHMNFSRAAEELHLSQPAVSTQIKEFASHVGLPLFERIGRKTFLTPAGEGCCSVPAPLPSACGKPKTPWRSSRA